ncbi:hypothetical protein GCM10018781_41870 [Kitasatospora indigofera]|uniref:Uncharacterized protein n=1 Tax=Kitasatospora indigofera TaxID=67307 RepID=A0A919FZE9_9ACTN|nr:hypothetical protein GCM10018781_41870 [Kitasatospora indigofera]
MVERGLPQSGALGHRPGRGGRVAVDREEFGRRRQHLGAGRQFTRRRTLRTGASDAGRGSSVGGHSMILAQAPGGEGTVTAVKRAGNGGDPRRT